MSLRIPYDTIKETVKKAFLNVGLSEEQAEVCATIHTQSSADGVESHGLNRIPRFVEYVQKGWINLEGKPELAGARERWRIMTAIWESESPMHCSVRTVPWSWPRNTASAV